MPSSTTASVCGSRATLATKLLPRSSIGLLQMAGHFSRGFHRRTHDRRIAGTAAQTAGEEIADFLLGRSWMFAQEMIERHQDARGAKSALQGMIALERRLQNAEAA